MSDSLSNNQYEQQNPLGGDPRFLSYLQGFLANPKDADKLKGRRISPIAPTDGQLLVWSSTDNAWKPSSYSTSGYSGSVTLAKLTSGGANGSLTVSNGLITAYSAPT